MTRFRSADLGENDDLINEVYANVYRPQVMKRYEERKGYRPEKNIPAETLLTMKIDVFLNENYEIRKNVMRGVAEYRERTGIGFSFRDLAEQYAPFLQEVYFPWPGLLSAREIPGDPTPLRRA